MRIQVTVCNICKDRDKPTQEYEVRSGSRRAKLDLCVDDGATAEALLEAGLVRPRKAAAAKKTTASRSRRVTPLSEIEKQKK